VHFTSPETCPHCHLADPGGRPDPGRFSGTADTLCLGCHRKENLGRTHPINIRPGDRSRNLPADLRLTHEGRMMCLTCHSGHGRYLSPTRILPGQKPEDPAATRGGGYKTFFLRRSDAERGTAPLCEACHGTP